MADKAEFREQDLFKTDLTPANVVTMNLLPDVSLKLQPSLLALKRGTRIVSHDWCMGNCDGSGWKPDRTTVVPATDKKAGLEKSSKVHVWTVPARAAGATCNF